MLFFDVLVEFVLSVEGAWASVMGTGVGYCAMHGLHVAEEVCVPIEWLSRPAALGRTTGPFEMPSS